MPVKIYSGMKNTCRRCGCVIQCNPSYIWHDRQGHIWHFCSKECRYLKMKSVKATVSPGVL